MKNNKTQYQEKVISRVKKLRMDNKISQAQLGDILSISPGLIGNIESYKFPHKYTLKQLYEISNYFNISIENIFIETESEDIDNIDKINSIVQKIIEYDK